MKFSIFQGSRQGPRPYNQDRLAYAYNRQAILLVLADGMGGHQHGEVAADIAVKSLIAAFEQQAQPAIRQPAQFLQDSILQVHASIERLRHSQGWTESPRTTVVVGLIQHQTLFCAHVGDSRLYLYRHGLVKFQTRDHSVVQSLLREGKIRVEQVAHHPHRNKIYNCVGGEKTPNVELSEPMPMRQGDVLLLCSDGVWGTLPEVQMAHTMLASNIGEAVTALLDQAEQASLRGGDNMSAIGLQWGEHASTPFAISTLDLPADLTTRMMSGDGKSVVPDLTEDEIERAIQEIQQALHKSMQTIKPQES